MRNILWAALITCAVVPCAADAQKAEPQYKQAPGAMATLPFSEAVRVGDMLYISGAIGVKPGTRELVTGGIAAETRQTMENIKAAVERHGSSMDSVVKCLVMLADMKEWGQMNEVYVTFFPKNKPARSAFGASGLAMNARVEIECMAAVTK
jgi:2-iminobutanoate/2-iminopropanoate deaminase